MAIIESSVDSGYDYRQKAANNCYRRHDEEGISDFDLIIH